jgi:cytochrome c nitrite reductase small subunit
MALSALSGIVLGLGAFTFRYAEGLSYFSSDPQACANCHIMNDAFASWEKGPHHARARCVDCHLPHALVPKLLAKTSNGYHHSKGFTFQDFHEPIRIKPGNAEILQQSCLRCHGELVHDVLQAAGRTRAPAPCVHCHGSAGHGARS